MITPIKLSDHFTAAKLLRFTAPAMGMLVITSLYSVVDGFFVSNFVGKTAFVAINLIFPFIMIPATLGTMLGTGGSALVAKTLGEGKIELANSRFSLIVYFAICLGIFLTLVWLPLLRPVALALGADGEILSACMLYGWALILALTPMCLQFMFQSFFPLAERPRLGLWITIAAGIVNSVLDAFLIIICGWGLFGAAVATIAGMLAGSIPPLIIFCRPNISPLRLGRAQFEIKALLQSCVNGSSELMSNISLSVIAMCYNYQLLHLVGENGVAAYGVIMYVSFIFLSVFMGYGFGIIPIIGYKYGCRDFSELKGVFSTSLVLNTGLGILLAFLAIICARPLAHFFVGYDQKLMEMTRHACFLYAFSFLFAGINIFASSFFTGLNNGPVSAIIAFGRTFAFQLLAVFMLPVYLGVNGIWLAAVVAEICALGLSGFCFYLFRETYMKC